MLKRDFESLLEAIRSIYPYDPLESRSRFGGGGCINNTHTIILKSGRILFLKENSHSPEGMFREEAVGLEVLSKKFSLKVPAPLAVGKDGKIAFLILENIVSHPPVKHFWTDFGRALARMHKAGGSNLFGFNSDNYIGSTRQINDKSDKWGQFFAEKRLMFQVELARSRGLADKSISDGVENICSRIDSLLSEPEHASLLHGDLWSGNYMIGEDGRAVLIDPAVYYGHREADLAMTELFGGFNSSFYSAYNEEYPLDKGYSSRRDLYNLYHMLNHLNLFGSSYSGSVRSIISAYQ